MPKPSEICRVVAGKLTKEFLRSWRGPAGIQDDIIATMLPKYFTHNALVVVAIEIVHFGAGLTIVETRVLRRPVAKIHHTTGNTKLERMLQRAAAQLICVRISEIHIFERCGLLFRAAMEDRQLIGPYLRHELLLTRWTDLRPEVAQHPDATRRHKFVQFTRKCRRPLGVDRGMRDVELSEAIGDGFLFCDGVSQFTDRPSQRIF